MQLSALKCSNCAAPMAPDVAGSRFLCAFCGFSAPFASRSFQLPMTFRHQPVKIVDGYMKLGHVYIENKIPDGNIIDPQRWGRSTDARMAAHDLEAFQSIAQKKAFVFECRFCGGSISGYSTQTTFRCPHCQHLIADADVMASGAYRKEQVIGDDGYMPDWQLPFDTKPDQARQLIKSLIEQHPDAFAGMALDGWPNANTLSAICMPHELADLRLRAQAQTERGSYWFYCEWFNWALPKNPIYDACLLDALQPWDFGKMQAYDPAYLEGDIRVLGLCNGWNRVNTMERIILEKLPHEIREAHGLQKAQLTRWSIDYREHKHAFIALPIYHAEIIGSCGAVQAKIAINGQTGKVAAAIGRPDRVHYCYGNDWQRSMTPECSMHSRPVPVRYVKSPFLYEIVPLPAPRRPSVFS